MACGQLVQHVQASAAYLKSLSRSQLQRSDVLKKQCVAVKSFIEKIQGPAEALEVARAVQEHWSDLLSAEQLASIIDLLNDAACKPALQSVSPVGEKQQHWENSFWKDIPKTLFDDLSDKAVQSTVRMGKLFHYLAEAGLRLASEKTIVAMLTLYFYVDGCPVGADANMLYAAFQHVKTCWKNFIQDFKARGGGEHGYWEWRGPPPGELCVRLDFVNFMAVYNQIPMRSSNASLNRGGMVQPRGSRQFMERSRTLEVLPSTGQPALTDQPARVDSDAGNSRGGEAVVPMLALPRDGNENELQVTTIPAKAAATDSPVSSRDARKSLAEVTAQLQQVQKDKKKQDAAAVPMKSMKRKVKKAKGKKKKRAPKTSPMESGS